MGFDKPVDAEKIRMDIYLAMMEEMAGDKTEHGKRQPGERATYERKTDES